MYVWWVDGILRQLETHIEVLFYRKVLVWVKLLHDHPAGLEQQKLPIESDCEADGNKNSNINHRQGTDCLRKSNKN